MPRVLPVVLVAAAICVSHATAAELLQPCECGDLMIQVQEFTDVEWDLISKLGDKVDALDGALKVYALPSEDDAKAESDLPPVFGHALLDKPNRILNFDPKYELQEGVHYKIVLTLNDQKQSFSLYRQPIQRIPDTVVTDVYPTSDHLPENLLKFYIHFSAPMSFGGVYEHIDLIDQDGRHLERPFLEIAEELWDPTGTRLTLLLDPARVKRELVPHEEDGAILYAGRQYQLVIKSDWLDSNATPLKQSFIKTFTTVAADYTQPLPKLWRISPPAFGTSDPLQINVLESLDHAILSRGIKVIDSADQPVEGDVMLSDHETIWSFKPVEPWKSGAYRLKINERIEDLVGNSIAKPFEVDKFEQTESTAPTYRELSFKIGPSK